MKSYVYKVLIASLALIFVFKFTIGKEINNVNEKINFFTTSEGRKQIVKSLKKEISKANNKENYLDEEEKILLRNFINKIKQELEVKN